MDFDLAIILKRQGRFNESIKIYKDAIKRGERDSDVFIGLGKVFYLNGDYEKANLSYMNAFHKIAAFNDALFYKHARNENMLSHEEKITFMNNFSWIPEKLYNFGIQRGWCPGSLVLFNNKNLLYHYYKCNVDHDNQNYRDSLLGKVSTEDEREMNNFIKSDLFFNAFSVMIEDLNHQAIHLQIDSLTVFPLD